MFTGPNISTSGLVLALDAANTKSYPGSGATWYDMSGRGNNSTLYNGIGYNSSNVGILNLDGTDDYIAAPSVNTLGNMTNSAWEIWVKSSGLGSGKTLGGLICPDYGMVSYINGNGSITYQLYSTDAGYPGAYILSIGTSGINCFDDKWHHVVCTRQNNGTGRIYFDGQLNVESGNTGNWSGTTLWSSMATSIGNNPNDAFYNLKGNIAIAKIYTRHITQSEVSQNYNSQKSRFNL